MNVKDTLDPQVGGKIRTVLYVAAALATSLQSVDWSARIPVIAVAVISALAHLTTIGNKTSEV